MVELFNFAKKLDKLFYRIINFTHDRLHGN
jgi:hypothetical protein